MRLFQITAAGFGLFLGLAAAAAAPKPAPPVQAVTVPASDSLTRSEWLARTDGVFRSLDGRHRGYLDKPTLKKIFWSPDSPDGSHIPFLYGGEAKFDVIDFNRDGRITEQEYSDFAGRVFDIIARDGRLYFGDLFSTRFRALLNGKAAP